MSYTIAVDVDLTVVDSLTPWKEWYLDKVHSLPENPHGVYDVVPLWREHAHKKQVFIEPFDFWKMDTLYDNMKPIEGSIEKLTEFYEKGWNVIFVSLCVPEHEKSKRDFIDRHFPFARGFISTGDKEFVKYDIFVDDRETHIRDGMQYNPKSEHYLFTGVERERPDRYQDMKELYRWEDLEVPYWSRLGQRVHIIN